MDSDKFAKVKYIYGAVLDRPPDEREAYLRETCGNDQELRNEVNSLLAHQDPYNSLLDAPPDSLAAEIMSGNTGRVYAEGEAIGHYKIVSRLGRGGMGEVFLAQDDKLDRKVALKILPSDFAKDKDRLKRFVREAKSASALNHPNIITIYEIGESEGTQFIAAEFIEGKTLGEYTRGNRLSCQLLLEIAIQIAAALETAHSANIVHRDVKPDNVMIRDDGLVKVLDFGIAKLFKPQTNSGEHSSAINTSTSPGMIVGTANYMSPEQAEGKEIDARTDIFSFGVVLYEMIAGHLPFEGDSGMKMIGAILNKDPLPLDENVPMEIAVIVNRCLQKEKGKRFQTIREVGEDLKNIKQDLDFHEILERSTVPNRNESNTLLQSGTRDDAGPAVGSKTIFLAAGLFTLILIISGFLTYKYIWASAGQINSIAVIPFENKSSDADTDYLSDGLAESLIFRLTQLPGLKVSPTSSVMRYKGKETEIAKIASELSVDAVMTGRLIKRGDNLNISVELVDARSNKSLWGEQYERKLSELLTTQREITGVIVSKLRLKLSGEGEQRLSKTYTDNNEAYQLYLKGRYYWNKRTEEDINKAIEHFKAAAEKDPTFALAYVGLADCYSILPFWSDVPSQEVLPLAKIHATKAVILDDSLGEAHVSLAYANALLWDWAAAEKGFKRGLELNSNYATGHKWYGQYLSDLGRVEESLIEYKRAQELEPLSLMINANVAEAQLAKNDAAAAAETCKRVIELDPDWYYVHQILALSYFRLGRSEEALAEAKKAVDLSKGNSFPLGTLGYVLAQTGKREEAVEIAEQLRAELIKRHGNGFAIAWTCVGLDDKVEAYRWLEKDFEKREASLPEFLTLYPFNTLRDDERFKDLRNRMGLPE